MDVAEKPYQNRENVLSLQLGHYIRDLSVEVGPVSVPPRTTGPTLRFDTRATNPRLSVGCHETRSSGSLVDGAVTLESFTDSDDIGRCLPACGRSPSRSPRRSISRGISRTGSRQPGETSAEYCDAGETCGNQQHHEGWKEIRHLNPRHVAPPIQKPDHSMNRAARQRRRQQRQDARQLYPESRSAGAP
jgi:hypothetical protein